jgi:molybdate transport system regulatory protein
MAYPSQYAVEVTSMRTSARNQLPGVVTAVKLGNVMAQIDVDVSGSRVISAITREAAEELALKAGDRVVVIVKATEVMIGKPEPEGGSA